MAFDRKEYRKLKNKEYNLKNKEKIKEHNKKYWDKNKDKLSQKNKEYYEEHKESLRQKNIDYSIKYQKDRKKKDPIFKLKMNIYSMIYQCFKKNRLNKNSKTQNILGCTLDEFKTHIENQFEPWMNWDNMGGRKIYEQNKTWDVDHIIPIHTAKTEEDIIKLNHYTNLRPLCSYNNRFIKRNK